MEYTGGSKRVLITHISLFLPYIFSLYPLSYPRFYLISIPIRYVIEEGLTKSGLQAVHTKFEELRVVNEALVGCFTLEGLYKHIPLHYMAYVYSAPKVQSDKNTKSSSNSATKDINTGKNNQEGTTITLLAYTSSTFDELMKEDMQNLLNGFQRYDLRDAGM